jgi:hypothetical protein
MRILTYITATLLLLIPGAAIAQYVTPEELYDQTVNGSTVPRNPRQAKQAAAAQESKASTSSKPTLQEWWLHSSEEPSNTPQDTPNQNIQESSTPTLETSPSQIEEENTLKENGTITLDPIENRRQERIEQLGGEWLAPSATDTLHSTALHSGAPLTGSGPASTMAGAIMLTASAWTLWKSSRLGQKTRTRARKT